MERITIVDNEKLLRMKSSEVDFLKDDILNIISSLKEYCTSHIIWALSPVQIGIPKRIIYIKNTSSSMDNNEDGSYDEGIVYINPKIISAKGHTRFFEGCESCVYFEDKELIYYMGNVDRPYSILVSYQDINGNKKTKTIEGFEATIFCHEYDHLNGILHMDRIEKVFTFKHIEAKEYRNNHPYEILSKDCNFSLKDKNYE